MPERERPFEPPKEFVPHEPDKGGDNHLHEREMARGAEYGAQSTQENYARRLSSLDISDTDLWSRYAFLFKPEEKRKPVFISDTAAREISTFLVPIARDIEPPLTSEEDVKKIVQRLITGKGDNASRLNRLKAWCSESPKEHIAIIERAFGRHIESGATLTFSILALFGELQQLRAIAFVEDELAKPLELRGEMIPQLRQQLSALHRLNDSKGNLLLHKILDFVTEYMTTVQDHVEQELEEEIGEYHGGFFEDFWEFAKRELPIAKNYLMKKHWQEIVEVRTVDDSKKEGALPGVGGGASDEMIYTFRRAREAYDNRLSLGINEGYPTKNPVFQVAPGYMGYYKNGRLEKVFLEKDSDTENARAHEAEYIQRNDPEDEYIYDKINEPLLLSPQEQHPSNKLRKLETIRAFSDHLKEAERKFFFDLSRIDLSGLHPLVAADFLIRNQEYLHEQEGKKNREHALSREDFIRLLYPRQKQTPEQQLYDYLNVTQLHMRKKIEDDFGIKFEKLDFLAQRHFLHFLETKCFRQGHLAG